MKGFSVALVLSIILFTACGKKNSSGPVSSWSIGDSSNYTASHTENSQSGNYIKASDGIYALVVHFAALPVADGEYTVVQHSVINNNVLTGNNISIEANINAAQTYVSSGSDNVKAQVTVAGGKVNIAIPPVWCLHYNYAANLGVYLFLGDSLQIKGTLKEY